MVYTHDTDVTVSLDLCVDEGGCAYIVVVWYSEGRSDAGLDTGTWCINMNDCRFLEYSSKVFRNHLGCVDWTRAGRVIDW